ncbi:hypothetical protein GPECTOR_10g945 [Gonium pectorale]|uniref:CNH domain-containing protein n=1 Tax=Gonium pectorale TaxID=33097 RepID=A0A150GR99_GONPE|nr:hypothetical protein GPECTOR_10g945 [Gonium pectorale]|eukprot:KXZ52313.1 hypothetical protein GPECTOR_10g945 [Gonium pectorale]
METAKAYEAFRVQPIVPQVAKAHRSLDRKAVLQMAAVRLAARPLLLVLTEAGVNLHTLPDMLLKFQPMGSRGASLFAWSEEAQLLAVAVILYQLRGSELLESGERLAPDVVLAMAWVAPGQLVLGLKRQYLLMNTASGATTDLGATGTAPAPLAQLCPGGQELLLARDSTTVFHNAADGRALTATGHYAVAVTAGGLEVRSLRRAAESHVLQRAMLAEPPRAVAPALAADGAVFVVVGSGTTGSAGGAVPATATAAAGGGSGICSIYRLTQVPLEEQAHTLAEMGEYGEALALAALVEDDGDHEPTVAGDSGAGPGPGPQPHSAGGLRTPAVSVSANGDAAASLRSAGTSGTQLEPSGSSTGLGGGGSRRALLEERLRLAYGHYLFQTGEYDEGMAQLALCKSTTALVLLRLFPSLVPAKFRHLLPAEAAGQPLPEVPEPAGDAFATAVSQLLPYILSHRTRAITALADGDEARQAAAAAPEGATPADAGHPPGAEERNGSHAHATTPARSVAADWATSAPGSSPSAGAPPSPSSASLRPLELLAVLDTAIVRMLVVLPDSGSLLRFVQLTNYVDLQEGEQALSESGMYAELAALYRYNGRHEEGLELLRKLSQEPEALPRAARGAAADLPGLPGVWAAVRYMVTLSAQQAPTIQRHAGWILAADPEAGLSALLHMRPPLDPSLALGILHQHSRHYCGLYLETALQIGVALPQDYHNELLLIYLRDILSKEPPVLPSVAGSHTGEELKGILLAPHPADADQPAMLFPEELAQALLHHGGAAGPPGAAARRYASAPASSAGTPSGVSRAPSQASMASGAAAPATAPPRGARAASTGAATGASPVAARRRLRDSLTSGDTGAAELGGSDSSEESTAGPSLYQRLRDLVYTSPYIDPGYVLDKLPPGELLEIRALMLERLGCHRDALRLYLHALRDLGAAEAYCDRVYAAATGGAGGSSGGGAGPAGGAAGAAPPGSRPPRRAAGPGPEPFLPSELEQPGDIYLELVQALYDGPESCPSAAAVAAAAGGHGSLLATAAGADGETLASVWRAGRDSAGGAVLDSPTWQALSRLLSRKRDRLDPLQVLKLLPDGVAVADVLPWLEGSLRYRLEVRRNLAVIHQLRRSENLAALEEAIRMRQQRVVVTAERACSLCHKRIGGAVSVSYPGGLLAHYLCHRRHTGTGSGRT